MPWIHVDWGAEGNLNKIVLTDDDAEVIAECINMSMRQESSFNPMMLEMEFIVPDSNKFHEATAMRAREATNTKTAQLKHKSGEIKDIQAEDDADRKTPKWLRARWDENKWHDSQWLECYDQCKHDLDGATIAQIEEEAEWAGLTFEKGMVKADKKQAVYTAWADEEFQRRHIPKPRAKAKKKKKAGV
jgi:hypothetical protein